MQNFNTIKQFAETEKPSVWREVSESRVGLAEERLGFSLDSEATADKISAMKTGLAVHKEILANKDASTSEKREAFYIIEAIAEQLQTDIENLEKLATNERRQRMKIEGFSGVKLMDATYIQQSLSPAANDQWPPTPALVRVG